MYKSPPAETFDVDLLTLQEEKILHLAADDMLNKEIADELNICESTVKKHRENCYRKLNVKGKKQVRKLLRRLRNLK
jgi:DNA-binding NarL/FixJ family response regulator